MKLLIHTCCAPCLAAPLKHVQEQKNIDFTIFWYNPNIHPYLEYKHRLDTLKQFVEKYNLPVIYEDVYGLVQFTRAVSGAEAERCDYCYESRLQETAKLAKDKQYEAFTTTLLYSRYQKHDRIKEIAESVAKQYGLQFYYQDWRIYWQEGITISKAEEMYRQQYCGCIYSEMDRYKPSK